MASQEKYLLNLRQTFEEKLKDIEYMGAETEKIARKMILELEEAEDHSLEKLGIKIVKLLKYLKGNTATFLNTLQQNVKLMNEDVFYEMQSELFSCTSNVIIKENDKYRFAQQIDKETMTDATTTEESKTKKSLLPESTETSTRSFISHSTSEDDCFKSRLSLQRQSTSDTLQTEDDNWIPTLQRVSDGSPSKSRKTRDDKTNQTIEETANVTNALSPGISSQDSFDSPVISRKCTKKSQYTQSESDHEEKEDVGKQIINENEEDSQNFSTDIEKFISSSGSNSEEEEILRKNKTTKKIQGSQSESDQDCKKNVSKQFTNKNDGDSQNFTTDSGKIIINSGEEEDKLRKNKTEEVEPDKKNSISMEGLDYENPYSIETLKNSSSDEETPKIGEIPDFHGDHSSSVSPSNNIKSEYDELDKTVKVIKEEFENKTSLEKEDERSRIPITISESVTNTKVDEEKEIFDESTTPADDSSDSDIIWTSDDDGENLKKTENTKVTKTSIEQKMEIQKVHKDVAVPKKNITTPLDSNNLTSKEKLGFIENTLEENDSGLVNSEDSQMEKSNDKEDENINETPSQTEYSDIEMNNESPKTKESSNFNYINEEHNYESSNSAQNRESSADSDDTDIDRPADISKVQLNVLDNFSLEEGSKCSQSNHSEDSFEFDISNNKNKNLEDQQVSTSNAEQSSDQLANDIVNLIDKSLQATAGLENQQAANFIPHDNLLDCTLEEYLFGDEGNISSSQSTIIYSIGNVKIEQDDDNELNEKKVKIGKNIKVQDCEKPNINDIDKCENILKVLKEISDDESLDLSEDELDASLRAEKILEVLHEEELSEISSSDDFESNVDDLNDLNASSFDEELDGIGKKDEYKNKLKEYGISECFIVLERMEMSKKDIRKYKRDLNDDVDWLCDLKTINTKSKKLPASSFSKRNRIMGKKRSSTSSKNSSSDLTSSDDDNDGDPDLIKSEYPNLSPKSESKLDNIIADVICNDLQSESDEESSDSSVESAKKKKRMKEKKWDEESEKPQLSKEEMEKRKWRNDPLLKENLSDSDDDKPKAKKIRKYEHDSDFGIDSDHFNSNSDSDDVKETNKSKSNTADSIKKFFQISSSSSNSDSNDSDSDVQYVSPKKSSQNADTDNTSASQKGRRDIRSILSDRDLTQETLNAKKEEMERIERLKGRHKVIEKLSQSFSSQETQEEEETSSLILDMDEKSGKVLVEVNKKITKKLKPHQHKGIKFMWDSCYESLDRLKKHPGSGCILAHCMGLGKTFQVLSLCHTLFSHEETNTKHILVVCPLSTVNNWIKETKFAFAGLPQICSFFSISGVKNKGETKNKYSIVKEWYSRKKSMLVLGYECFVGLTNEAKLEKFSSNLKERIFECLIDPGPDLVICDEGHLIKNKKALKSLALNKIKTKRRIVLTGTPLQNNLIEYYHMVQFVKPNLLGNISEFRTNFVNPISNGQFEDSNNEDITLMMKSSHVLSKILGKTVQRFEDTELEKYLPRMLDHAVFIQLSHLQVELYNHFSNTIGNCQVKRKKFLADFNMFQLICTHPHLLALHGRQNKKVKEKDVITNDDDQPEIIVEQSLKEKLPPDSNNVIEYGNKLRVLKAIIEECEAIGDKLLVFSQNLAELDLIEHFLKTVGTNKCPSWKKEFDYFRMDGNVVPERRAHICDMFNDKKNSKIRLLLMSTKVGGLGLNLTSANRVVIMTVNWNPSYDIQSVFRVYRFGQQKQVYVYRLVALDTMEEKVYQRQVTKLAVARRVVDKHQIDRHYKSIDLRELYSCKPNLDQERPTPNVPEDEILAKVILKLSCIYKYHEHKSLLANRPEDKLSEQELATAWEDFKNNKNSFEVPPIQPQHPPGSQFNVPNGPTFSTAYNLQHDLYYRSLQNFSNTKISSNEQLLTNLNGFFKNIPNASSASSSNSYLSEFMKSSFITSADLQTSKTSNNDPTVYLPTTSSSFSPVLPPTSTITAIPSTSSQNRPPSALDLTNKNLAQFSKSLTGLVKRSKVKNPMASTWIKAKTPTSTTVSNNQNKNPEMSNIVANTLNEVTKTSVNNIRPVTSSSNGVKRKLEGVNAKALKKIKHNFNNIMVSNENVNTTKNGKRAIVEHINLIEDNDDQTADAPNGDSNNDVIQLF